MRKKAAQLLLFAILILGVFLTSVTLSEAGGNKEKTTYTSPLPKPLPSCKPTPTQIPIPTIATDSATWGHIIMPTPTATPTPEITPNIGNVTPEISVNSSSDTSTNSSSPSQGSSQVTCTTPIQAPLLQGFKRNSPTSVTFSYWPSKDAASYVFAYGYTKTDLVSGIPYIPNNQTSITVNSLKPNVSVWGTVYAVNGACSSQSDIIDP